MSSCYMRSVVANRFRKTTQLPQRELEQLRLGQRAAGYLYNATYDAIGKRQPAEANVT